MGKMVHKLVGADNVKLITKVEYSGNIKKAIHTGNMLLKFAKTHPLLGLAANQIGIMERVCLATIDNELRVFINPVITEKSGKILSKDEGCLSFPHIRGNIWRHKEIIVKHLVFSKYRSKPLEVTKIEVFTGFNAIVLEHEIEHLEGIRCIDRMKGKYRTDKEN